MRSRRALVCAALMLTALACTRDEPVEQPTAAPPTSAPASTAAPRCSLADASTGPRTGGTRGETALLRDVRIKSDGCPRVVFEFANTLPTYDVRYGRPPFSECGSGDTVDTSSWGATAYLVVKHEPAMPVDLEQEGAPATYTGSYDIQLPGPVVKRAREICRFEAVMQWVIGLDRERQIKVSTLPEPPRLIVDISEE
jgi:hypothetical protein